METEKSSIAGKQHVFIIGCKGIPANYGGFETFVEKLTQYQVNGNIQYHVACAVEDMKSSENRFIHNNADCFMVKWKPIGPARAIFYDMDALKMSIRFVRENNISNPIFYILACRIGPVFHYYQKIISKLNGKVYVNPDGHEWLRAKWCRPVRWYWKWSEALMVKHADLLICDSINIEKYIQTQYKKYRPRTTYIAYGAETIPSSLSDGSSRLNKWYGDKGVMPKEYYLVVGRFVPENNYEIMIKEFMESKTKKSFVLITNVGDQFLQVLKQRTDFTKDSRIKFAGTVYDQELLKKIRENAYGYFHGHEVGGTNPSLLEALGSTDINLLLDVGFNREVAEDSAVYWTKEKGSLAALIGKADGFSAKKADELGKLARARIKESYSWKKIVDQYESLFSGITGRSDRESIDGGSDCKGKL